MHSNIYKGLKVYLSDSIGTQIASLGNYVLPILIRLGGLPTTTKTYSNPADYKSYWAGYTTDLTGLGNMGIYDPVPYAMFQLIAPLMRNIGTIYSGYIKLVAASGYYALGQLSSNGGVGSWKLYDDQGNVLVSSIATYNCGFPFSVNQLYNLTVLADQIDSNGQITATSFQNIFTRIESGKYVTYGTSSYYAPGLATWLNGVGQSLNPDDDTDPYANLPIAGDDPIPDGDSIPEPSLPGLSAASTGIIGLFCPTVAQMQQLADFMWTDFGGQGTTVIDVLEEIVEAIKRAISNPLDYIFGLNIIPSQGLTVGASKVVKFGFVSSGVSMPVLSDHYFIVDCGSITFDVLCNDSFLDYAPYSKFSIYLPYIGFKDIDPNDCVGHTISVKYHGDAITGGLTAYVLKDGNVMYQYSGGCALNVPLSSDNWGATIASAASIATGVISAAASGGAAGVGLAAAKGAASVAANPSLLSPQVMHSGAVSGAPGFMGVQYPFIVREAVNFHSTAGFNKESGYPAYYYKALSEVTGFTTVLDPHINGIPQATQGEIAEIISLLESGVIL